MKVNDLFGKKLVNKIKNVHAVHATFTKKNTEMKELFIERFNKKSMAVIVEVVKELGYDAEVEALESFVKKLDSNNFDDTDVEVFKQIITPYQKWIVEKLRGYGNLDGEDEKES